MSRKVPEGWTPVRLGALVEIERANFSVDQINSFDSVRLYSLPAFDSGAVPEKTAGSEVLSNKYSVPADCILFSKLNPRIPRVWRVKHEHQEPALGSTEFWPLKPRNDNVSLDFLTSFLTSGDFLNSPEITPASSTNSHQRVDRKAFENFEMSLPPLHEQRRIAEILSTVNEAIVATRAVIEQTRKVKQGVLDRLLTKGMGHTRFKQTDIGEIPEGWATGKVGDFFTLQRGFDITEKQSNAGKYPVISSSGISYFHSQAMVRGPAVITGRKGKLGQVHFIDSSCWPHDTTLWVKDFKGNQPKFVYWFLRSLNLEKFDAATAVPTLNRNVVHALTCVFPSISEQLLIADHLDSIEATEEAQTRNLAYCRQMKSALMFDLLTGRKRVADALPMAAELRP